MNIELQLTGMTPGGDTIGRYEGRVVFVPFALPGETVEVQIIEDRRSFWRGRLLRVLAAAPERVSPRCRHFGTCGGCQWQMADDAAQVRFKTEIVREQLTRIARIENPPVLPCIASPNAYGYRNHARLAIAPSGRLGYRASASHNVVEIDECPILEESLLPQVLHAKPVKPKNPSQSPSQSHSQPRQQEVEIRWQTPSLRVGDYEYAVSPDSFFQANSLIAAKMVDWVLAALPLTGSEALLDLYCGVGLFTLPLAMRAAKVIGIESNPSATADAGRNLAAVNRQRPNSAQIITAAVADGLKRAEVAKAKWDAIVLDPPRAGVDEVALQRIIDLRAPTLVYISCDPATLARDLQKLVAAGYQLLSAQPFDMFPQTFHVETCCVLRGA